VVAKGDVGAGLVWRVALTSLHGVADNPDLSYAQLVRVDEDGKGVFAIALLSHDTPQRLMREAGCGSTRPITAVSTGRGRV
jgi:hypothetical protein